MISEIHPGSGAGTRQDAASTTRRERRALERRDRELRFCVVTEKCGKVLIKYFRNPQDAEGVTIRLTSLERDDLAEALAMPGAHFIARDDSAEEMENGSPEMHRPPLAPEPPPRWKMEEGGAR